MYAKLHAPIYLDMCACIYRLRTVWTDEKAQVGGVREEQRRSKKIREEKSQRKKMQVREKVGKSRITVFLRKTCGSGGSKSRLPKAAGPEPSGQLQDEQLHDVVAPSQNVQKHTILGPPSEVDLSKK